MKSCIENIAIGDILVIGTAQYEIHRVFSTGRLDDEFGRICDKKDLLKWAYHKIYEIKIIKKSK